MSGMTGVCARDLPVTMKAFGLLPSGRLSLRTSSICLMLSGPYFTLRKCVVVKEPEGASEAEGCGCDMLVMLSIGAKRIQANLSEAGERHSPK